MSYTTQSFLTAHRVGLEELIDVSINKMPKMWPKLIGHNLNSRQAFEKMEQHSGLSLLQDLDEGQGMPYDHPAKLYEKTITPTIKALGIKVTKSAMRKDVYGLVEGFARMLAKAANARDEFDAAKIFNLAFAGGGTLSPDGVAFVASNHPIESGTSSNLSTNALSAIAIEDALQVLAATPGYRANIPWFFNEDRFFLLVPPGNAGIAHRIVDPANRGLQGTNNNDANSLIGLSVESKPVVNKFLGLGISGFSDAWFLCASNKADLPTIRVVVSDTNSDSDKDFDHIGMKLGVNKEDAFDVKDWRGVVGANP